MELSKRPHKNGARRRRNKTSFATSCTAIGWASMLFAVSGVAAFSGHRSRAEFRTPGSQEFSSANFVALWPQDSSSSGHSDDGLLRLTSAANRRSSTRRFATSTRLNYRDGDEHEPQARREETARATEELQDKEAAKWWQSVFQPAPSHPPHEDEEQQVVDEYLQFLDKRYKRLHEKEKKKPEPAPKKFSALGWLTAGDKSDPISEQQEEDALYVLGVAELASERLLQKHHAALQYKRRDSAQEAEKEQEVVIDAVAKEDPLVQDAVVVDESSETRKALVFATLAQTGRKVLTNISKRRKALIAYQEKKVIAAMLLAFKTTLDVPAKALKLLWNIGGGKKTVALTASAFITVFLVARPVAQAVMSEATLSA